MLSEAFDLSARRLGARRLGLATERTSERYAAIKSIPRNDLLRPAEEAIDGGAAAVAVLSPGQDVRRVIRELWPTLGGPLRDLTGDLVARSVERLELSLIGGETPAASLRLVTASDAAARFEPLIAEVMAMNVEAIKSEMPDSVSIVENAARFLRPKREGATLTMSLTAQEASVSDFLAGVATPLLQKARRDAQRNLKLNSAKQIALAFYNFADSSGTESFPANAAIVDNEGRPLLSWRVALLPFLEETSLFLEFRLDEPWDSEHNLRVAQRMPNVFANPTHPELTERGLTTWQLPVYPGSDLAAKRDDAESVTKKYAGKEATFAAGDQLREFIDGLSNTILFTEVAPEHAAFWTRPDDWRVDLDDPLVKLRTETREGFVFARADGAGALHDF